MSDASEQKDRKGESATREPEQIRADIEQTREEFGDTAAAVAEKADVKAQATAKVDDVKQQAAGKAQEAQKFASEKPLVVLGVALVALVVLRRLLSR